MRYEGIQRQSGAEQLIREIREGPTIGVIYRGYVVNNADPSGTGRVKVDIPSLYSGLEEKDLPWALPCFNTASFNAGSFTIPQVGDNVWILFENNDIYRPVYIGSMYSTNSPVATKIGSGVAPAYKNYTPGEALNPSHYVVMKTPQGSGLWMDDENKTAHFGSASGGGLDMDDEKVTIAAGNGGSFTSSEGKVEMISPLDARIGISDGNGLEDQKLYMITEDARIFIYQGKYIQIEIGEGKKVILDEEGDSVKIQYNESTGIEMNGEGISMKSGDDYISMSGGDMEIRANRNVKIIAPSVDIVES